MLAAVSCPGAVLPRARIARPAARRAGLLTAAAQSAGAAFPIGTRVRVKDSIVVYHVPKQKMGLTLQGMTGTVEKHADVAPDGKSLLSATQPLVVRFETAGADGKNVAFTSHLTTDEVEAC